MGSSAVTPNPSDQGLSAQDIQDLVHIAALLPKGDPRAAKISAALHENAQATGALPTGAQQPSAATLYGQALFNPVGSGAHSQGVVGGLEQTGGRALQAMSAPLLHPLNALEGVAHSVAHPIDTAEQRVQEFKSEYQKDPALAFENAAGDVAGMIEGGRAAGGALETDTGAVGAKLGLPAKVGIKPVVSEAADAARNVGAKYLPSLVDGPSESLVTRAVKPGKNNVGWNSDVRQAIPLMKSAEQQLGRPIQGVDDALDAATTAKKSIWQQYQMRLGAGGQMGATIDGNQIANAMVNSIDRRTAVQNPGLVAKVQQIANTYRHPISVDDAEDFLQSANKDLNSYYAKNKVGQQVALNDPEMSSTVAEAGALRSALYNKLDQVSGPGAAQLKQAYGSLTNVEKELYGRQLVAARQNPESLSEQLSTVRGAGKIAKGVLTANPGDVIEGAQNIAVSRAIKARNTSDAMIERAFAKAKPATPFPMPASPRIAGLLQRGPIAAGAPTNVSGTNSTPPPFSYTTRAQRLGLTLPAQTGGPIELPYVPEMSGGERLAALMQLLRRNSQLALPSQASSIPLPPQR